MSRALIGFRFIFTLGSPAHKYVLQLYMYVLFVFSYAGYGLVALFTGTLRLVGYYMSFMYYRISKKSDLLNKIL